MSRINIDNQVVEAFIKEELDKIGIEYFIRNFHDTALDGVYELNNGYGYIEVKDQDDGIVKEILDNYKEDNTPIEQIQNKKMNIGALIIILIMGAMGLAIIVLSYNNWSITRKYNLLTSSNKYHHEWKDAGTEYLSYKSGSNIIDHIGYDNNRNGYFEKIEYYYKDGKIKTIEYSKNDDGVYDHFVHYDEDGNIYEESFYDQDKNLTQSIVTYNKNKQIIWSKTNNDGPTDILQIKNNGISKTIKIEDVINLAK
jgi:hypothetical protein